jgi:hypothetical protein
MSAEERQARADLLRHLLDLEVEVLHIIALAMQLESMASGLLRSIDALQRPLLTSP